MDVAPKSGPRDLCVRLARLRMAGNWWTAGLPSWIATNDMTGCVEELVRPSYFRTVCCIKQSGVIDPTSSNSLGLLSEWFIASQIKVFHQEPGLARPNWCPHTGGCVSSQVTRDTLERNGWNPQRKADTWPGQSGPGFFYRLQLQ